MNLHRLANSLLLALLVPAFASADVVLTKDGSRLVGTVTHISAGALSLDTAYAGTLSLKQSEVVSIQTEKPVAVRLATGTRIDGTVATTPQGQVQITNPDGTITTSVGKIAMIWPAGSRDPLVGAWSYEATVDVEGTSGNKQALSTGGSFTATLVNPNDTLKYYGAYDRATTDGVKSADQFKAGIDYAHDIGPDEQWFLRDETGFDRVMGIRFSDVAAGGWGFDLVKTPVDVLLARIGVGYSYQDYESPLQPIISSAAGDLEIAHDYKGASLEISNSLVFVPTFNDFSAFTATQDSFVQVPLKNIKLKLRAGISNNYNSKPGPGLDKLDTLYYLRMVYDFGAAAVP